MPYVKQGFQDFDAPLTAQQLIKMEEAIIELEEGTVPSYTEGDHGKVLSCTENGLVWIAQAELPDAEEASF